jgi:hypothetical protein
LLVLSSLDERKKVIRQAFLRWHPDKFDGAFGSRLLPADRERIRARVTATAQHIAKIKESSDKL